MKYFVIVILALLQLWPLAAQNGKREVRAAWLTTVYGLDWPHTRATDNKTMHKQQKALTDILDCLQEAHFNTVLFQVRTRGDVLYDSSIEPYNAILTGRSGKSPGYDPLAFVVEECHKRGMECHAWMVTVPLGTRKQVTSLGRRSAVKRYPSICVSYKQEYFLNPGHPQTKEYLMNLVDEVVRRYDVDGIHLDYLRYPEHAPRFPDAREYKKYGKGRSLSAWRRDNITEIVRHIYRGVKQLKPWVKVSCSPVGKHDDLTRYSSRGWNARRAVHQDVQSWLAEGIQDQIYPMMYFRDDAFYPFALDWQEQSHGRHVVPGLGIYFLDPKEGDWTVEDVERQLNFTRDNGLCGQAHYRIQYLMDDTQGMRSKLTDYYYTAPALVPAMPWIDDEAPTPPASLRVEQIKEGYWKLVWEAAKDNDSRNEPTYVVYASDILPVDTTNPKNIMAQGIRGTQYIYAPVCSWGTRLYFAVTAVDRYGNESEASTVRLP